MRHQLLKGNLKSALVERGTMITSKLVKEFGKGWCIPILSNHDLEILKEEIAPLGLAHQGRINERVEIIEEYRVSHYLSFPGIALVTSMKERMDRFFFAESHYGHMHKRLLHSIVNVQVNYPTTRILIKKDDFKSAYRRHHLSSQAAIQLATWINWKGPLYILISLRLTFG